MVDNCQGTKHNKLETLTQNFVMKMNITDIKALRKIAEGEIQAKFRKPPHRSYVGGVGIFRSIGRLIYRGYAKCDETKPHTVVPVELTEKGRIALAIFMALV